MIIQTWLAFFPGSLQDIMLQLVPILLLICYLVTTVTFLGNPDGRLFYTAWSVKMQIIWKAATFLIIWEIWKEEWEEDWMISLTYILVEFIFASILDISLANFNKHRTPLYLFHTISIWAIFSVMKGFVSFIQLANFLLFVLFFNSSLLIHKDCTLDGFNLSLLF